MSRSAPSKGSLGDDVRHLRTVFAVVPWRMRWRIIGMALAAALAAVLDLAAVALMLPLTQLLTGEGALPPLVQEWFVPVLGTEDRQTVLIGVAALVGTAFLVKNIATIAIRWWSVGESQRAASAVQAQLLHLYATSRYVDHRSRSKSSMTNMITAAVPASFGMVLTGMLSLMVDVLAVVTMMMLLLVVSPVAALAAIVIFGGFALLIARVLKPYSLRYAHRNFILGQEAFGHINPAIEGFREMRLFRRESLFTDRFRENRREAAGLNRFQVVVGELPRYLLEVVMVLGILVVALLLFATQDRATAFGLLAVFATAAMRITPSLNRSVAAVTTIRSGSPSLRMLAGELEEVLSAGDAGGQAAERLIEVPEADIVVEDVGFRYPDSDAEVLSGVCVRIRRGSTVALVGGSGAGKTTFADILAGLLQPTSGTVRVGEVDITEHPRSWIAEVGMVSQRVYLWDASVRDLITFAQPREQVDEQLLADVLRRSRLDDVVAHLPEGPDTTVGDAGTRLSGGQTQRLGIARALYSQPAVLILDEATSALDNETERQITETIEQLHGELTVIVIAHRLSTVKNADDILYFSRGRLAGQGTMTELVRHNEEFAHLVELGQLRLDEAETP